MAQLTMRIASAVALDAATSAAHGGRTQLVTLAGTGVPGVVMLSGRELGGVFFQPAIADASGNWSFAFYLFDLEPIEANQGYQTVALVIPPIVPGYSPATPPPPSAPVPVVVKIDDYLGFVQPQHRGRPNFIASLTAALQPSIDNINLLADLPRRFDLDVAEGTQLDAVGLWAGVGRVIRIQIAGVFFAWDTPNAGWDYGKWRGPLESTSMAVTLDDATFRMLIRARIAANHWDGTLAGAADAYGYIFADPNTHVFIQDNQDHTFSLNISGRPLGQIQMAMLTGGYLPLRPVGVTLATVNTVSIGGTPLFGFDDNTALVGGWDTASWGVPS